MKYKIQSGLLVALLLFCSLVNAKDKRSELPHPYNNLRVVPSQNSFPFFGEKLEYEISWSFLNVGKAYMAVDKAYLINATTVYHVISKARSTSVIDYFFHVDDTNESWISGDFSNSFGYLKKLREGNYLHDEWVIFNYQTMEFYGKKMDRKGNVHNVQGKLLERVHDVLSSLYYVRILDFNSSSEFIIPVNSRKNWQMKVKVHSRKKVKTKFGKRKCWKIEPMVGEEGIFVPKKGKSMYVWISDDEERLPMKLEAEIFIGSIKAELIKAERIRH